LGEEHFEKIDNKTINNTIMKKNAILLFSGITLSMFLNAAIITVDNNYPSVGDYSTLQAAHDAAGSGDTIKVYPSVVCYEAIDLTKQLFIIGAGWESPQAGIKTANICDTIVFLPGSEGSMLEGFGGNFVVNIQTNSIQIIRNFLKSVHVFSNTQSTYISQNLFEISDGITNDCNLLIESYTEAYITNNTFCNHGGAFHGIIAQNGNTSLTINNNVFYISLGYAMILTNSNHLVTNNIIARGNDIPGIDTASCFNNMCTFDQFPGGNGNLTNVDMATVFADYNNCDFHLVAGSPAFGSGLNGTDMGIYGGDFPFVDGGYPGIPIIYYLDIPATGSQQDGLEVTIKARSNN